MADRNNEPVIVRAPGGTARREVRLSELRVPDLWHLAMRLEGRDRAEVLDVWHLCHDLIRHIREGK
jgi:hypothetical protein